MSCFVGASLLLAILKAHEYRPLGDVGLDVSQQDVAYLYSAYGNDRANGTTTAANFADAIRQHEIIDRMIETSAATFG